jgi:YD repeat-containing protein
MLVGMVLTVRPLPAATLVATRSAGDILLSWDAPEALLEEAYHVTGPWTVVPDASNPWVVRANDAQAFYRLRLELAPILRSLEPARIAPGAASGATVYVDGRNLNSSHRLRLNGEPLSSAQWIEGQGFRATLPALAVGSYKLELTDPAGNVLSQLWPALQVLSTSDEQLRSPPEDPASDCAPCEGLPKEPAHLRLYSGEVCYSMEDLRLRGRGLDVVWKRTYLSRTGPSTAQGHGWDFSYNVYLTAAGADLVLHDGQGRADAYFWQGDGTWMRPELAQRLRRNPDGSWTLEFADRAEWSFHPLDGSLVAGRLALLADRNGNRLAFAYDPAGRLSAITDSLDRTVTVQYGAEGFIESLSDFSGRTVRYQYYQNGDADGMAGDLKAAISPAVTGLANGNNFPAGKTNRYTYAVGFADERRNHNLLTVTDPKGQVWLRNTYATNGDPADLLFDRCLRQVHGEPGDIMDVTYWPEMPTPANAFAAVRALVNDREGNVSERVLT